MGSRDEALAEIVEIPCCQEDHRGELWHKFARRMQFDRFATTVFGPGFVLYPGYCGDEPPGGCCGPSQSPFPTSSDRRWRLVLNSGVPPRLEMDHLAAFAGRRRRASQSMNPSKSKDLMSLAPARACIVQAQPEDNGPPGVDDVTIEPELPPPWPPPPWPPTPWPPTPEPEPPAPPFPRIPCACPPVLTAIEPPPAPPALVPPSAPPAPPMPTLVPRRLVLVDPPEPLPSTPPVLPPLPAAPLPAPPSLPPSVVSSRW